MPSYVVPAYGARFLAGWAGQPFIGRHRQKPRLPNQKRPMCDKAPCRRFGGPPLQTFSSMAGVDRFHVNAAFKKQASAKASTIILFFGVSGDTYAMARRYVCGRIRRRPRGLCGLSTMQLRLPTLSAASAAPTLRSCRRQLANSLYRDASNPHRRNQHSSPSYCRRRPTKLC